MSWKLYEGDCFDYLPLIEDKSIDMILCDLPYGTTACKWDTPLPLDELWFEYKRIIKDNGAIVLTASQPFTTRLISSNYDMFKYNWVVEKSKPTGHLNAKIKPMLKHDDILIFGKNKTNYFPQGLNDCNISIKRTNKGCYGECSKETIMTQTGYPHTILKFKYDIKPLHPTQKPVALFEYLIKTYTNPSDLVLDNCAGSGTTGVACENLNRNSILMEQEPDYCQIIKDRMATAHELKLEQRKQTSLQQFKGQQTLTSPAK